MKTAELTGAALDWVVAKCESTDGRIIQLGGGLRESYYVERENSPNAGMFHIYQPSTRWDQGGPIIEREKLNIEAATDILHGDHWLSNAAWESETPLIAAMRCYVASKLGDEVTLPEVYYESD